MKKISIFLILFVLLFSVFSLSSCSGEKSEYQIVVNPTDKVQINDKGFVVEANQAVTIPQCEVYDSAGNYCDEFQVSRVITDENGNRKSGTLQMKHGEVYKVVYTATNGEIELSREIMIYCYDTVLPTLSLLNMQRSYNKGDTISIKVNTISNDIDYDNSSIHLLNSATGVTTELSFSDTYSFVAENESEVYKIIANLKDINGNTNVVEQSFVIVGRFIDENIDKNNVWDFDELSYINNIKIAGESDALQYSIETNEVPEGTNGGALKLDLKANERYVLTLIDGNGFTIEDCSTLGFKVWASEVVDVFELYNVDDATMYDLSWRVNKRNSWQNVEFDPLGTFSSFYKFNSIKIILSCEEDVTVYIDSIYYTDYIEPWRDADIPSGDLALFDDAGYLERITEQLSGDNTYGGTWDILTSVPETTDFTGGVLKLTSTTDAYGASGTFSRDGFKFELFDKLSYKDLQGSGLVFRIYCVDAQTSLSLDFYDQKLGKVTGSWFTIAGAQGRWVNVIVKYEYLADVLDGCENITHLNIRFIRRAELAEEGSQESFVAYIDKISLYNLDYDDVEYTFVDEYDTRVVENIGNCAGMRASDSAANDGWSLYGITQYSATGSGLKINFNHLDISEYSSIYVRLRTELNPWNSNAVNIYGNGVYLKYGGYSEYTSVDILPYLLSNNETHLDSIEVKVSSQGVGIYIDDIIFVKKEDAPVYENFTINASDLHQFVGVNAPGNFDGGNTINIEEGSIKLGKYNGKDNVLVFTTTPHILNDAAQTYSGGGLYIDLRDYVASGKIVVLQDFTVTISVYLTTGVGHRIGVVYGEQAQSCSWNSLWKNPYDAGKGPGWYTITVTSDELRALSGCATVEMTGIYIGLFSNSYTCAIESVSFAFAGAHECENACGVCGNCLNSQCEELACENKCLGHTGTDVEPAIQDNFTLDASDLQQFVGVNSTGNFSAGNTMNVDEGSVKVEQYKGKDNILVFTTTPHMLNGAAQTYSGGGLYIDLRDYLAGGKIAVSQSYTIKINVYLTTGVGHRIGVVYGEHVQSFSWDSLWKNPYDSSKGPGWYTITITSDELRALGGCSSVEMTGIYIGIFSIDYTCGIESIRFIFTEEHECENVCNVCGNCLNSQCEDATCENKCQGHSSTDIDPDVSKNLLDHVDFVVDVEEGRDIRVLQLTDIQTIEGAQKRYEYRVGGNGPATTYENYEKYIGQVIQQYNPDFIIVTGDNVYGEFDDSGEEFLAFIEFMDSFGIPWSTVFGNHDNESNMGVDWQCEQLENSKYCLFKQRELTGNGNYSVALTQGGEVKRVFYMLDSNGCAGMSEISFANGHSKKEVGFGEDQISWYTQSITQLKRAFPDVKISMAFHIQLSVFMDAFNKYGFAYSPIDLDLLPEAQAAGDFGYIGSAPKTPWDSNYAVWNSIKNLGVDSIFVGHEHRNSASIMYEGVRLTYGQKSSTYDRYNSNDDGPIMGGTYINISSNGEIVDAGLYLYDSALGYESTKGSNMTIPVGATVTGFDFNGTDFNAKPTTTIIGTNAAQLMSNLANVPLGYEGSVYGLESETADLASVGIKFSQNINVDRLIAVYVKMYVVDYVVQSGKTPVMRIYNDTQNTILSENSFYTLNGQPDQWVYIDILDLIKSADGIVVDGKLNPFTLVYRMYGNTSVYFDSITLISEGDPYTFDSTETPGVEREYEMVKHEKCYQYSLGEFENMIGTLVGGGRLFTNINENSYTIKLMVEPKTFDGTLYMYGYTDASLNGIPISFTSTSVTINRATQEISLDIDTVYEVDIGFVPLYNKNTVYVYVKINGSMVCWELVECYGMTKGNFAIASTNSADSFELSEYTPPVYEDFTLNASDLQQFVGVTSPSNFDSGNTANVEEGSIKLGKYNGKDNVIVFTTTPHISNGNSQTYSGGGLYIDLRDYVTNGKIAVSQNFTITISVYLTTGVGHRIGVVYGKDAQSCSWYSLWKNPYDSGKGPGWYTITVTSDELRGLSGCATVEMTGIYIGLFSNSYTCAIESVSFAFAGAHECENACGVCGNCLNSQCEELACENKCPGHTGTDVEPAIQDNFTLDASDLQQFVGVNATGNFSAGNTMNVEDGSVKVEQYKDKDNVLVFKTTPHMLNGAAQTYSGGGLYIDLRDYLAGGKIAVSQEFTITINAYLTTGVGHRIGVVYGEQAQSCSWDSLWENPYDSSKGPGWYTITVTSDELRALGGCSSVEMTGIYIGLFTNAYTCGIESISFTFEQAE